MKSQKYFGQPKKGRVLLVRRVKGESMLPTLRDGQIVVATGRYRTLQEEDVVVIRHRGLEKIKRIRQVVNRRIFVQGDNRARSTDSHTFGWLDNDAVVGKVIWPRL